MEKMLNFPLGQQWVGLVEMKDVGGRFTSFERSKQKLIYRARESTIEEHFFCNVLG